MKNLRVLFAFLLLIGLYGESQACTSAIITAAKSSEGVPMLWKHRDSKEWDCNVAYIQGERFAYTAVVSLSHHKTFCGINEKGFAVMNTVSSNISRVDPSIKSPIAVELMGEILGKCGSVEEFEVWLKASNGKRSYVTNYAVGDSTGAVAYFEVSQMGYTRYDATEREEGFDVRSNFSFAGDKPRGKSQMRYDVTMAQMKGKKLYTPYEFIDYSRNYLNNEGSCPLDKAGSSILDNSTIARFTSAASAVMVCDAENPRMLVCVGHPAAVMAVPVYVKAKSALPECVKGVEMLNLGNEFRTKTHKGDAKEIEKMEYDKARIEQIVKINTVCKMPSVLPKCIEKFNAKIDKLFAKHATKVRKVLE